MVSTPVVGASPTGTMGLRLVGFDGSSAGLAPGKTAVGLALPISGLPLTSVTNDTLTGSSSYSFLTTNSNGTPVRFNPCAPIHYVTNLAQAPSGAGFVVAIAFARISAATGLTFVSDGPTTEVPSMPRAATQPRYGSGWAPVVVAWASPAQSNLLPGGNTIGEGGPSWVQVGAGPKVFVTGEVVIDQGRTANLAVTFGAGASLGQLLLHELGHVFGLGHTTDPTQVMYPVLLPSTSGIYGNGDLAGLDQLGSSAGCVTTPQP